MPGSGKVLSTLLFDRALTEQQSWQEIAQSKGMTYLQRLPEAILEGQFLVHNSVRPTHPLGSYGFRAWLQAQDEHLEPCDCGWTPELGTTIA